MSPFLLRVFYASGLSPQDKAELAVTVDDAQGLEQAIKEGAKVFSKNTDGKAVVQEACRHHSLRCLDVLWETDPDVERWQAISRWAASEQLDAAVTHLMGKGASAPYDWHPQELTLAMVDQAVAAIDERRQQLGISREEERQDDLLGLLPFLEHVHVVPTPGEAHFPSKREAAALAHGAALVFEAPRQRPVLWLSEAMAQRLSPLLTPTQAPAPPRRRGPGFH